MDSQPDRMKGNIMEVELAIQRELAYRRKVAMLNPQRDGEFILPLQVQPPDSSFSLSQRPDTRTSTQSHTRQSLAAVKPATTGSSSQPRSQEQNREVVETQRDHLFCKICRVLCSSTFNKKQHIRVHKHKARVRELNLGQEAGGEAGSKRIWCPLCGIWCMDDPAYSQHLEGQKHRKAELLGKNNEQQIVKKTERWCEMCGIFCTDDNAFEKHLKVRRHVFNLHKMEGKKRARKEDGPGSREREKKTLL